MGAGQGLLERVEPAPQEGLVWRLSISCERPDDVALVTLAGRVGQLTSGRLTEVLMDAIASGDRRIVVDLANVDYMSSAGLLALEAVAARLATMGGDLVLCAMSKPVRRAFDLAGLLDQFPVEPSREAAIARLRTRPVTEG
jgi:anti-anti-sigma factor